jgi:molybdopterin-containing oxidoreductase family iron-sulfur binding subunit
MTDFPTDHNEEVMVERLDRRKFLRAGGAAVAVGAVGLLLSPKLLRSSEVRANQGVGKKYVMVIDLSRCFGCRACMQACKIENNTPEGMMWMYVFRFEEGTYPHVSSWSMPRPCMHCDNAPCVKVCPVGARYKREDGLVATDRDRCIGCRYCQTSCPYSVNYFEWKDPPKNQYYDWLGSEGDPMRDIIDSYSPPYSNPSLDAKYGKEKRHIAGSGITDGVTVKCTFCVHRIERGLLPACVAGCPGHVYHFGDIKDPDSEVSKILAGNRSFRLLEEAGTKPSVYYINGTPPGENVREIDAIIGKV